MKIDGALLEKLQKLGMIRIDEDKKEEVKNQLLEILGFLENLSSIDVSEIEFQSELKTPLREDVPRDSQIRQNVLETAPCAKDGFFIVPKIIE